MIYAGVGFVLGAILGYFLHTITSATVKAGELFFYDGEPGEPPAMVASLDMQVADVCKEDYVTFKVSRR